jgi:glycine betaine/choline ABC-type transport system substrate-binding protein
VIEAWQFAVRNPGLLAGWVATHVVLSLVAITLAIILGIGTGIYITGSGREITDDKSFFPPYDLTPYVRQEVLSQHKDIETILNKLVATFPGDGQAATPEIISQCREAWQTLNGQVDIDKMEPTTVATNYLQGKGLVSK